MGHCVIFSGKQDAAPPSRIVPVRLWYLGTQLAHNAWNKAGKYASWIGEGLSGLEANFWLKSVNGGLNWFSITIIDY